MTPLKASGLQTYYGKSHILHDVGLTVNEGEIVAKKRESGNVLWRVKSIATGSPDWTSRVMHCRRK